MASIAVNGESVSPVQSALVPSKLVKEGCRGEEKYSSGHSWQQTQIIWQQTYLHGEEEGVGHAAVVAARVVAAPLVRVRMGTCGGRKGTASLRCPI